MKKKNEDQYAMKKQEILIGFREMVAKDGFENVSMAKLAKKLEIPSSLIFYYFENKRTLTEALVDFVLSECTTHALPSIVRNVDSGSSFEEYMDDFFDQRKKQSNADTRVYFECRNLALRDQFVWEKFLKYQNEIVATMKEDLAFFQKKGEIRVKNLDEAANFLYCLIGGTNNVSDFINDINTMQKIADTNKAICKAYMCGK